MSKEIENQNEGLVSLEDQLRDAAELLDSNDGKDVVVEEKKPEGGDLDKKTDEKDEDSTDKPENSDKPDIRKSAETSPEKKEEVKQTQEQKPTGSKAQKDAERLDRSWKSLDAEKAAVRKKEQELAHREEQLAKRTPVSYDPSKPDPRDPLPDFSVAQLEKEVKRLEEEGNHEMARSAERVIAAKLRIQTEQLQNQLDSYEDNKRSSVSQQFMKETQKVMQEDETLRDPQNPFVKRVNALLQDDRGWGRYFTQSGDGIHAAMAVARLEEAAELVPALQKKVGELENEIKRLNKATSLHDAPIGDKGAGGKTNPRQPTEGTLRQLAEEADRMAGVA